MTFQNFLFGLRLQTSLLTRIKPYYVVARSFGVHHSPKTQIFYVTFRNSDKQAVLYYKTNGKLMDIRGVNVPAKYKGLGIARLLTETAFTYAILNDYYLYLTCSYAQKYYLATKNKSLDKRIVGPNEVLDTPVMLDPATFESLPDPEDPLNNNNKKN